MWQCSKPCHNRTYDNETVVKRMVREQKAMRVPSELVPYCPLCGAPMSMNLRADSTFVEDAGWNKAANRYQNFLRQHKGQHILYLELGVGENTPVFCSLRTGKSETKTLRKQRNSGHLQILTIDYAERRCA